jgi:hypothetical protein
MHFRSEAGRVRIKPLLDKEAAETQQAQAATALTALKLGNDLPAALLQQYPALAAIDWKAVPEAPPLEGDYSDRMSFDASGGNDYYDDMSDNEMLPYRDQQMGA